MKTKEFFVCACDNLDHLLVASIEDDGMLTIGFRLYHYVGLLDRIKLAVKYVLRLGSENDSYSSHWDVVLLTKEAAGRLRDLCERAQ
jgi:hypothetical protein